MILYYLLHSLVISMFVGTQGYHACLYFCFLDQYLGAHEEIVLASLFCFQIDVIRNTRRLCLPFFSDWVHLCSITFPSYRSVLANVIGLSDLLQRFGWDDLSHYFLIPISYCCTLILRSCRLWSICITYTRNRSRVVFLLNFGLAYLLFLMNNGSDKPSKYWCSLYVVGITWDKLKSV